jgi:S-(hydroxymethyl)glutathione dehydrogenase/alcohol dehydrogenase
MVGVQPPGAEISVSAGNLIMDRSLIGAFHGAGRPRVDFQWLVALYMDGRLKLDELITRYRPLDEINEAFDDMNRGMTAWTVLTFS